MWHTSSKGLIVTHGHTFTGSIPFKDVCEAINEVVAPNDLPVFISLECHVDADKQPELVKIMEDVWGDKLLKEKLQLSGDRKVSPDDLRGRIVMMVYVHFGACISTQSNSHIRSNGILHPIKRRTRRSASSLAIHMILTLMIQTTPERGR